MLIYLFFTSIGYEYGGDDEGDETLYEYLTSKD